MEHYTLGPEEVFLYRGTVTDPAAGTPARLLLTNLYLVLLREAATERYPVTDIKCYRQIPQVRQTRTTVEIFLVGGERTLQFKNVLEAARFTDRAFELLTGKTKLARGAGKVRQAIDDVNEAFGTDLLEAAKNLGIDTVSGIVSKSIPAGLKLLAGKKKKSKAKK